MDKKCSVNVDLQINYPERRCKEFSLYVEAYVMWNQIARLCVKVSKFGA